MPPEVLHASYSQLEHLTQLHCIFYHQVPAQPQQLDDMVARCGQLWPHLRSYAALTHVWPALHVRRLRLYQLECD